MNASVDIDSLHKSVYTEIVKLLQPLNWDSFHTHLLAYQKYRQQRGILADVLPILACMAVNGRAQIAIPLAATWVLYTIAGRIVDDIHDDDTNSIWLRDGHTAGMYFGSSVICLAQILLSDIPTSKQVIKEITKQSNYAFLAAAQAQANVIAYQLPSEKDYFSRIYRISGNFIATAMWTGGRLGSTSPDHKQLDSLYNYGLAVGMMAQLLDDCRDFESDVQSGLFTLPIVYAMSNRSHPQYPYLLELFKARAFAEKEFVEAVTVMNGFEKTKDLALLYRAQAMAILVNLPDTPATRYLEQYIARTQ